jgi:hypothetical protein
VRRRVESMRAKVRTKRRGAERSVNKLAFDEFSAL